MRQSMTWYPTATITGFDLPRECMDALVIISKNGDKRRITGFVAVPGETVMDSLLHLLKEGETMWYMPDSPDAQNMHPTNGKDVVKP